MEALQEQGPGSWINLGVDRSVETLPPQLRPGIGLRPGGERPELEDAVVRLYVALYDSVAAHARAGFDVVLDVDHHEAYSQQHQVLRRCAARLTGLAVLWIGVRCPIDVIWQRRSATWNQHRDGADPSLLAAVERWQQEVHAHHYYDLEVDTSTLTPEQCGAIIVDRLADGPRGMAFAALVPGTKSEQDPIGPP